MVLNNEKVQIVKVSASSNVNKTATSIVKHYEEDWNVEIVTVGAGALNQAVKAIIAASASLATKGVTLHVRPFFDQVEIEGQQRTAIRQRLIFLKNI